MRKSWAASPAVKALLVVLLVASVASAALYVDLSGRYGVLATDHETRGRHLTALEVSFSRLAGAQGLVNVTLEEPSYTKVSGVHVVSGYYLETARIWKTVSKGESNYSGYVTEGDPIAFIYSPEDGLTLEVTALLLLPENRSVPLTVQAGSPLEEVAKGAQGMLPIVGSESLTGYGFYRITLPTRGWYTIHTQGPISALGQKSWSYTNPPDFEYNLKLQFRVTHNGNPMLFAVRPLSR